MTMKLSDLPELRLARTGLSAPLDVGPTRVVQMHLAMQAQDFGPAKWSIGQRLAHSTDAAIDRTFSKGSILRTHVLRPTWHFVAARDLRWLMELSAPRVQKRLLPRYGQLGLDGRTRARAEKLVARALGAADLTRTELKEVLDRSRMDTEGQRLPHLLMHCELESVVSSGPLRDGAHTYTLFADRVPKGPAFDRDRAVIELVRRYLIGHAPATIKDMSWWAGLPLSDLKAALEALGDDLDSVEVDGHRVWWLGDITHPREVRAGRVHLLQSFDELIVGYSESRYLGDPRADRARAAFTDRRLPGGVVLVGSRIAGHWRRSVRHKKLEVEVLLYSPLRGGDKIGLKRAIDELARFLGRPASSTIAALRGGS